MTVPDAHHTSAVVSLSALSKGYRFYRHPAHRLKELLFRRVYHQAHWALADISFTVQRGETFGVIGENGAGKSTLLKLLAGTINPSRGELSIVGRVAALLELGAGFHPEETGRENVYLMAAISGVPRADLDAYYQSVAEFSELSASVLDRPVKTYSSGMFMRLAFATATALEPDILIVDEALSVGDLSFQKKSLDRIMGFRERGKTVIFCGHNMYQIRSLCQRALWLHEGKMAALGPTEDVVTQYESYERQKVRKQQVALAIGSQFRAAASSLAPVKITRVVLLDRHHSVIEQICSFDSLSVQIELLPQSDDVLFHVGIAIVRNDKDNVFGTSTHFEHEARPLSGRGALSVVLRFPSLALLSGTYFISVYALDDNGIQVYDMAELICPFVVHNPTRQVGLVSLDCVWEY